MCAGRVAGSDGGDHLRVLVGHGDRPEDGRRLGEKLRARLPAASVEFVELTDMGPAIGVHGGPGTLVVAIHRVPKKSG